MVTDKITKGPEIGIVAETGTKIIIDEEETTMEVVIETTDPNTGIVVGPKTETITDMGIGTTIDQIIEGMIVIKGMEIEIRIATGLGKRRGIGVVQEKVPNPEVKINLIGIRVEMVIGDKVEIIAETDLNQGQAQVLMLAQTGIDIGAIDAMSMTTLQGNALMKQQMEVQMIQEALF